MSNSKNWIRPVPWGRLNPQSSFGVLQFTATKLWSLNVSWSRKRWFPSICQNSVRHFNYISGFQLEVNVEKWCLVWFPHIFRSSGAFWQTRPTIISPGKSWTKRSQPSLLAAKKTETLHPDEQKKDLQFSVGFADVSHINLGIIIRIIMFLLFIIFILDNHGYLCHQDRWRLCWNHLEYLGWISAAFLRFSRRKMPPLIS